MSDMAENKTNGKKRKKPETKEHSFGIVKASAFSPNVIRIGSLRTGKSNNPLVDINHFSGGKFFLQFTGPGKLFSWSFEVSPTFGKTYFKFSVVNEDDQKGVRTLENLFVAKAIEDNYWPKAKLDPAKVQEKRTPIFTERLKDDDDPSKGYWPPNMKAGVDLNADTGILAGGEHAIVDHLGNPVNHNDLNGRWWNKIIISVNFHYFKGKKGDWGTALKFVKMSLLDPNLIPQRENNSASSSTVCNDLEFLD